MKKWIAVLLAALMLLSMTALAEGTNEDAADNALPQAVEPIAVMHYNLEEGYMLSYSESDFIHNYRYGYDFFVAADNEEANMLVTAAEISADSVDALLGEAVGGYGPDAVISEPTEKLLEGELTGHSGVMIKSIQAQEGGVINRFYLVYKPVQEADTVIDILCMTASFPADQAEVYGAKFDALVDGIVLDIPEAMYQGEGWSMWYPSELIQPQTIYTKEGFVPVDAAKSDVSMIVTLSDVAPEHVPDLLTEAMGGYEGIHAASEQVEFVSDNNMIVRWFETEQEGTTIRYYALWSYNTLNDDVYCITASFPTADVDSYGAAFDRMVESFALSETPAE